MAAVEFIEKAQQALDEACRLINAKPGSLLCSMVFESAAGVDKSKGAAPYDEKIRCDIDLNAMAERSVLLRELALVAKDTLPYIAKYSDGHFEFPVLFGGLPVSEGPEEWAESLRSALQGRLIHRYQYMLGLDLVAIQSLSSQPYEGEESNDSLVFIPETDSDLSQYLSTRLYMDDPLSFDKKTLRQVRKLLAGAGGECLVFQKSSDKMYVCKGYTAAENRNKLGWSVKLLRRDSWQLEYRANPVFRMIHGHPEVVRDYFEDAMEKLTKEFGEIVRGKNAEMRRLLEGASRQLHGTSIVFLDFDDQRQKDWIEGLYKNRRGIRIEPSSGQWCATDKISGMDGSLIINVHTMTVRYAAVILDGRAFCPGDLGRGSRHNGIQAFISDVAIDENGGRHRIAAAVFSEDGGIRCFCGADFSNPQGFGTSLTGSES